MDDYIKSEFKEQVRRAKSALKSDCPLIEDEMLIQVANHIAELEAHNNYLLNECNIFTDKALAEIKAQAIENLSKSVPPTRQMWSATKIKLWLEGKAKQLTDNA